MPVFCSLPYIPILVMQLLPLPLVMEGEGGELTCPYLTCLIVCLFLSAYPAFWKGGREKCPSPWLLQFYSLIGHSVMPAYLTFWQWEAF